MGKMKIILDITPLKNGFFPNASRSGIYFTLKNILLQLLKRTDVDLFFNVTPTEPRIERMVHDVLKREFPEYEERICGRELTGYKTGLPVFCDRQLENIARWKERYRGNPLIFFFLRAGYFLIYRVLRRLPGARVHWKVACIGRKPLVFCDRQLENISRWKERYRGNPLIFFFLRAGHFLIYRVLRHIPVRWGCWRLKNASWLSLMLTPPEHIRNLIPPERRYLLLYDAIPLRVAGYASDMNGWFGDVFRNLSAEENYLAISQFTRDDFLCLCPVLQGKEIPVVPLAAAAYFRPVTDPGILGRVREKYHIPSGKNIFLSHCSLAEHKNLDRLLEAFARFHPAHPDWIMVFSGSNSHEKISRLTRFAGKMNLPDSAFLFTGYVEDEELPALYSIADVFCFVSLYEGFGLPVLEAMRCGCPCLVSRAASLPEVAGEAACWVDPLDVDDIAAGLHTMASDPALRREIRRKGLKRAYIFSWRKCAGQIVAAIEKN